MIDACNVADDCYTGPYECLNTDGTAGCSAGVQLAENSHCNAGLSAVQDVCDVNGACVGKKIFIAFRIKHLSW